MVDTGRKFLSIFSSNAQKEAKWAFSINLKSSFKRNKSQAASVFLWEQFVNMHDLCHVWGRLWCSWSQQLFSGRRWRGRGGAGGGKSHLQGNRGARIIWACRRREGGHRGRQEEGLTVDGLMKEALCALRGDSRRRKYWHSAREGPQLKDTRTNNQLQILFSHHLRSPNYTKNSTKNTIITLRSCTWRARAPPLVCGREIH